MISFLTMTANCCNMRKAAMKAPTSKVEEENSEEIENIKELKKLEALEKQDKKTRDQNQGEDY